MKKTITRQDFLRATLALGGAALAGMPSLSGFAKNNRVQKNILMIPVDDLKPLLGCYGYQMIKSPNIDRLAARGTVFLNNYCQQAICGPSRASLMTGLYPDQLSIWDLSTRMRDINPNLLSMPQYFREQGYITSGIGKTYDGRNVDRKTFDKPSWSIPYNSDKYNGPAQMDSVGRGYVNPETVAAWKKAEKEIEGKPYKNDIEKLMLMSQVADEKAYPATECMDVPDEAYLDGRLAFTGCRMLEKFAKQNQPFFLSVGFYKPHLPFVAPKRYWDMYDKDSLPQPTFTQRAKNSPDIAYHQSEELMGQYSDIIHEKGVSDEKRKELIHGYHACISFLDVQVGKLLDKLDELGLTENTIVCLWGDHGFHLGDHGMWCKHTNFEQATCSPLIIAAPGKRNGTKSTQITGFVDVFPTLCDLAGLTIPTHLAGKSLAPMMDNPEISVREAILSQYPRIIGEKTFLDFKPKTKVKTAMGYSLRTTRYRYTKWLELDFYNGERVGRLMSTELYDYEKDPLETVSEADNPAYKGIVLRCEELFKEMNVAQHSGIY